MKKLFLAAVLGVCTFAHAGSTDSQVRSTNNFDNYKSLAVKKSANDQISAFQSVMVAADIRIRLTIVTTCGEVYSQVDSFEESPTETDLFVIADAMQVILCDFPNDDGWQVERDGTDGYKLTPNKI